MLIKPYDTESKSRNALASPLGEEGHKVAKGVQANWIHRGAPRPANPVSRHPAKSVCTRVRMIMILDVDVTAERRHYNIHRPRGRYQNPRPERPSNLRTLRTFGAKPRQPSRRRRVQRRSRHHNPRGEALSTLTPKVCSRAESLSLTPKGRCTLSHPANPVL